MSEYKTIITTHPSSHFTKITKGRLITLLIGSMILYSGRGLQAQENGYWLLQEYTKVKFFP